MIAEQKQMRTEALVLDGWMYRNLTSLMPVIGIAIGVLYLLSLNGQWKYEWDSAYYLMLAKSLLAGKGLTYLGYPCLKTPFGFPLLISPVLMFSKATFLWLNLLMLVLAMLAIAAVFLLFRRLLSTGYAALVTLLTAWCSLMLGRSGFIMIDVPYMAFSIFALFFIERFLNGTAPLRKGFSPLSPLRPQYFCVPSA